MLTALHACMHLVCFSTNSSSDIHLVLNHTTASVVVLAVGTMFDIHLVLNHTIASCCCAGCKHNV